MSIDDTQPFFPLRIAILTISDTRTPESDRSGPLLRKLAEKGFNGALSVELFRQELVNGDPYEVSVEIKRKSEAVMRAAQVL